MEVVTIMDDIAIKELRSQVILEILNGDNGNMKKYEQTGIVDTNAETKRMRYSKCELCEDLYGVEITPQKQPIDYRWCPPCLGKEKTKT